jgi:hypothetical protein
MDNFDEFAQINKLSKSVRKNLTAAESALFKNLLKKSKVLFNQDEIDVLTLLEASFSKCIDEVKTIIKISDRSKLEKKRIKSRGSKDRSGNDHLPYEYIADIGTSSGSSTMELSHHQPEVMHHQVCI